MQVYKQSSLSLQRRPFLMAKRQISTQNIDNPNHISVTLTCFLQDEFTKVLSQRLSHNSTNNPSLEIDQIADTLLKSLQNNPDYVVNNFALYSAGDNLLKGLRVIPFDQLVEKVVEGKGNITEIIDQYKQHVSKNEAVFTTITSHHHNITQREWNTTIADNQALQDYKDAATAMGNKIWVREGNLWMADFMMSFFRHGSAKKHYMKKLGLKKYENSTITDALARDLMITSFSPENTESARRIRVLDVGSCYNPLSTFPNASSMEVTAIDLEPSNPSVLRCDFLALNIGPEDSVPVFSEDGKVLVRLPANSFDAVCMSLVLSYLPSPKQRALMVEKARQLLRFQDNEHPHYNGLLLIMEKDSIFPRAPNSKKNNGESMEHSINKHIINMPFESMAFKYPNGSSLRSDYRKTIEKIGFETVKYHYLKSTDNRWMHCFAFAATAPANECDANGEKKMLWIRQDLVVPDRHLGTIHSESIASNFMQSTNMSSTFNTISSKPNSKQLVAIIGGGLGGAALAVALHRRNHPYLLFERDATFDSRRQGYALTMQQAGTALRLLGLQDEVAAHGVRSAAHYAFDKHGRVLGAYGADIRSANEEQPSLQVKHAEKGIQSSGNSRHNIHIPRQALRKLLISRLPTNTIQWSSRLVHLKEGENGVSLGFDNGQEVQCAVAVGADGIFSQTRRLLLPSHDNKLRYLGLLVVLGISPMRSVINEETKVFCQRQWLDGNARVFSMPFDEKQSLWQLSYPLSEELAMQFSSMGANSEADIKQRGLILKQQALKRLNEWDPMLRELIENTPDEMISGHPVYDRDPQLIMGMDSSMRTESKVTLLGDAAHPMSPFKGQGANQALLDALNLDKALRSSLLTHPSRRPVHEALRSYEAEMVHRSMEKIQRSQDAAVFLHSPAALAEANITRAKAAEIAAEMVRSGYSNQ